MNSMENIEVLFVGPNREEMNDIVQQVRDEFRVSYCADDRIALMHLNSQSARVIVCAFQQSDNHELDFCTRLRANFSEKPVQIIALVNTESESKAALDNGADDVLFRPHRLDEVRSRLYAAIMRLQNQTRIFNEREFFKRAAKQEEELSSRILDHHMVLQEAFQNIEAINMELEKANKKLEQLARFDILSGLLNRVSLFNAMDSEIERAERTKTMLSGIMMDIDDFKAINDNHGHLHGDRVIAAIGQRLISLLRKYDLAGRYGGEEFFVILPNTNLQQAIVIAERFRLQLQDNPVIFNRSEMEITASFGVARYHAGETRESWVSRTDANMYRAKQTGRNRVVTD